MAQWGQHQDLHGGMRADSHRLSSDVYLCALVHARDTHTLIIKTLKICISLK